jgi:hypothetical protein
VSTEVGIRKKEEDTLPLPRRRFLGAVFGTLPFDIRKSVFLYGFLNGYGLVFGK